MNHITDILDNTPFTGLTESDLSAIRAHTANCVDCAQAFAAAEFASVLLAERISEAADNTANANPFFQTRVLAAWREQQATNQGSVFARWWKPARALVSALALTTAALAALTFTIPESASQPAVETIAESTVLGVENEGQMTEDQMLSAMYVDEEEAP